MTRIPTTVRPRGGLFAPPSRYSRAPGGVYGGIYEAARNGGMTERKQPGVSSLFGRDGRFDVAGIGRYLDDAQGRAREANELRYRQQLGILEGAREESMGALDRYGTDSKERIDRSMKDELGNYDADAINRGVYNMGFSSTDKGRIREDYNRQKAAVDERAALLRSGVNDRYADQTLNVVGSRVDEYPNADPYLSVIQREAMLRAEESARNLEEARGRQRIVQNTQSTPNIPVPGIQPPQTTTFNTMRPGQGVSLSATSMGGGPPLPVLQAGTDPWTQYQEANRYAAPQNRGVASGGRAVYAPSGYMNADRRAANRPRYMDWSYQPGSTRRGSNRPR